MRRVRKERAQRTCGRRGGRGAKHACPSLDAEGKKEEMAPVVGRKEGAKRVTYTCIGHMVIVGTPMQSKIPR